MTTNAGGIPDMITEGVTGLVVQQDDHQAMARQALRLLQEPDSVDRIARRALRECEKYTWHAVGDQCVQLYEAVAHV